MFRQEKMAQAFRIIKKFNASVDADLRFPMDQFKRRLNEMGYTDDKGLASMSYKQWQSIGLREGVARKLVALYQGKTEAPEISTKMFQSGAQPIGDEKLCNRYLITCYAANPYAQYADSAEFVRARSGNRRCIGFEDDGVTVDIESSVMALDSLQEGDDEVPFIQRENKTVYLYKVGEYPGAIRDEHPFYPGLTLSKYGMGKHGIQWTLVQFEVRQLLRIAKCETRELRIKNREDHFTIFDLAMRDFASVALRFPRAAKLFSLRVATGGNPSLKSRKGTKRLEQKSKETPVS